MTLDDTLALSSVEPRLSPLTVNVPVSLFSHHPSLQSAPHGPASSGARRPARPELESRHGPILRQFESVAEKSPRGEDTVTMFASTHPQMSQQSYQHQQQPLDLSMSRPRSSDLSPPAVYPTDHFSCSPLNLKISQPVSPVSRRSSESPLEGALGSLRE